MMILHTLVSTSSRFSTLEGLYFCSNLARCWQYKKKRRIAYSVQTGRKRLLNKSVLTLLQFQRNVLYIVSYTPFHSS